MGAHGMDPRRNGPNMDVVCFAHAPHFADLCRHSLDIDMGGHGFKKDAYRFLDKCPRTVDYHEGNQNAENRVDQVPSRIQDDDAADDHAYRGKSISNDVEIGAADIEIRMAMLHKAQRVTVR